MELRSKSIEDLESQKKKVTESVGPLLPHGNENLSPATAKEQFPERYRLFVEALRHVRNPEYKGSEPIDIIKKFKTLNNLNESLFLAEAGEDRTLIPRQRETLGKIADFLESGYTEGHVTLPTGIGKTVIFAKLLEAATKNTGVRTLVVGPTKIILHQNRWKLDEFGEIKAGAYYGPKKDLSNQVTVTTYASLRNGIESGEINPKSFDMLILDEAHRALGEQTLQALDSFSERVVKIGFTATPEFHEEKTVADALPRTIDEMSVREAIKSDLLAGLKVHAVFTKKDLSRVERAGKEYKEAEIEREVNTKDRNDLVVGVYQKNKKFKGKLAVVYCAGVQHAKDMTDAFSRAGEKAAYIDGTVTDDEREAILRRFHNGEITVLCNARVLVEGFDESEAEVCINAAPTLSRVIAEQRGGRILRRSRQKSNKIGHIIEIIDEFKESENTPVLYSEIAGAAEIMPEKKEKQKENEEESATEKKPGESGEKKEVSVMSGMVDDPDEIMRLTNRNARQRFEKMFEYAPRGWKHSRELAHELGEKEGTIRSFAEGEKLEHPDWFKRYLSATEILVTHYAPPLSDAVRRHFNPALAGTATAAEFAGKLAITEQRAGDLLEAADALGSEKAKRYGETAYYPQESHERIIREEAERARMEDERNAIAADKQFWEDDERTDEEREATYWEKIESTRSPLELKGEEDGINEAEGEGYETIPYTEGMPGAPIIEPEINTEKGLREAIDATLEMLDTRERIAVQEYFLEGKKTTLEEIGKKFGVTRERVRGILAVALRKMRHPSRASRLLDFVDSNKDAEEEVYQLEMKRAVGELGRTPLETFREKFFAFDEKMRRGDHIGSMEKIYFDYLNTFRNSLIESERVALEHYSLKDSGQATDEERKKAISLLDDDFMRAILLRSPKKVLDFIQNTNHYNLSPDGKMFALYSTANLESEKRRILDMLESIKYFKENSTYYSPEYAENRIKELEEEFNRKQPRLREIEAYQRKYAEHFMKK